MSRRSFFLAAALSLACTTLVVCLALSQTQSVDLPPGPAQAKFKTACLECHDTSIIVQQRLSKAAWTREVDKMIKWGAVVDAKDRDALIDYLSTSFPPDKPIDPAPRAAKAGK